jgi:hypothetical protein
VVNEVNSNQTETSLIPSFNNRFLSARGDFRFSIAEFFAEMDSHNPATRAQAMEKFLAARTVLELQRVQESIKDNRNEKLINTNAQQQALMLAILHDPSTLGIDDAKRTLQKNIDSFCKSPEGQQLIANHSVQVAAVHEAYRNHHIDAAIKSWNSTHLTASELIVIGTKDEASRAFLDRQMTYSNELDSAARALISPLRRFLDNGVTSLTPLDSSRLAQSLELINQRNPNPQSTDGLIKMTITNDPSIINGLNSSNDITKITAVFKLLVAIRNSALEPALRDSAYSFVAQGLGSSRVLREADLLALRSDSYRPGYNADVNAVNLADLLDTRSQGADAVATAINSIIGGVLSTLLNDLRSGDPELESHAIAHISHDIANDPASADLNHLLEIDSSIKWDIMRSAYSSNTMTRCDFDGITRMANNLSALERYSRDIDGTIANDALEPLLRDLFIKTQSVNPQVDPRNMKSTHVQNEVREENQHNLNLLKSLVDDNITRASRRLPTFVHRVRIAHLGLIGEITDSVFKKAIV